MVNDGMMITSFALRGEDAPSLSAKWIVNNPIFQFVSFLGMVVLIVIVLDAMLKYVSRMGD
jgi:hypothetical protein